MKKYISLRQPSVVTNTRPGSHAGPQMILRHLASHAKIDKDGSIFFTGIDFMPFSAVFEDRFVISGPNRETLNNADHRKIISSSLSTYLESLGRSKKPNIEGFLRCANRECATFFRRSLNRYALDTSISVKHFPKNVLQSRGAKIQFLRRNPTIGDEVLDAEFRDEIYAEHLVKTDYTWIRIHSEARTTNEALEESVSALAYTRALWNLLGSFGSWTYRFGLNRISPKSLVAQGPVQWISCPRTNDCNKQHIWVEENWRNDQALFEPRRGWGSLEKNRIWAVRRIASSPIRTEIQNMLKEYCSALDEVSDQGCFLRLWILLERITNTQGKNYGETNKKASVIFKDRDLVRDSLRSLHIIRNRIVHADANNIVKDGHNALLKRILDHHILWLIQNKLKLSSIEEYADLLKIAKSRREIKRQLKLREKALSLVSHD